MRKSEIIGKLFDVTVKLEEQRLSYEERHKLEIEAFELNQILEHWKKEYEDEE